MCKLLRTGRKWCKSALRFGDRNPARLIRLGLAALLGAMLLAQVALVVNRDGMFYAGTDRPVGADFLVFYAAGRILAAGAGAELYSPARQLEAQREILGRDRGVAIFPYPAFVALPYALLSQTSLPVAYLVATMAMLAAALAAVLLLRAVFPITRAQFLLVLLIILCSQPFAAAVLGGQPVAFTLLCFVGIYAGMRQQRPGAAGIWLGLLAFKPQLAAVLVLVLIVRGQWRILTVAGFLAAGLIAMGMVAAGPGWPVSFFSLATSDYYLDNAILADGVRSISLPGLLGHLVGTHTLWTILLALLISLSILTGLVRLWRILDPCGERFPLQFAALVVATVLVSPHALFYEAALLILPLLALADRWASQGRLGRPFGPLLGFLFVFGFLWPLAPTLGMEPLALLPPLVGVLVCRELAATRAGGSVAIPRSGLLVAGAATPFMHDSKF
jgi:alpha-1,2-mannosyltransferase